MLYLCNRMNKAKIIATAIIIAMSVLLIAGLYIVYNRQRGSYGVKIERERYPVCGIDISAHNGNIDFDEIVADSIDFVMIKATEGTNFKDSRFHDNYRKARQAGLLIGAYHFFRFDTDGKMQGLNFVHTIRGKHFDFPLIIDVEEWGNTKSTDTNLIVERLQALIDHLETECYSVMIYTNKDGYARFIRDRFEDYPLWICSFTDPPLDDDERWTLWQYSHWGSVDGIDTEVDLNTFNGSRDQWDRWIYNNSPSGAL